MQFDIVRICCFGISISMKDGSDGEGKQGAEFLPLKLEEIFRDE